MRVMVFAKATEGSETGMAPTPEMLEAPRDGERGRLGVA